MIIDMRCRLTSTGAADYFSKKIGKQIHQRSHSFNSQNHDSFFSEIESAGITTAISVSGNNPGARIGKTLFPDRTTSNDLLASVQVAYPGKFIGVAGIDVSNSFHDAMDEIERCINVLRLKAVFIEPGRSPGCLLSDARLYPIYDKCSRLGVPIIPQTSGPFGGKTIDYAHPRHIDQIASDFPNLHIICGHGCYPYVREAIIVAGRNSNVWMSPDLYLFGLGSMDWIQAVNTNHLGFADKFLFASGYPSVNIKSYVEQFFKIPWNSKILNRILYKNALRALKLESDPEFISIYGDA